MPATTDGERDADGEAKVVEVAQKVVRRKQWLPLESNPEVGTQPSLAQGSEGQKYCFYYLLLIFCITAKSVLKGSGKGMFLLKFLFCS